MRSHLTDATEHDYAETRYAARTWERERRVIIKADEPGVEQHTLRHDRVAHAKTSVRGRWLPSERLLGEELLPWQGRCRFPSLCRSSQV